MERIPPDSIEELVTLHPGQGHRHRPGGAWRSLEPLLGRRTGRAQGRQGRPLDRQGDHASSSTRTTARRLFAISREDRPATAEDGRSRDLTVEEVQRIKDLVAKVGSLEFRILANSEDDKDGDQGRQGAARRRRDDRRPGEARQGRACRRRGPRRRATSESSACRAATRAS